MSRMQTSVRPNDSRLQPPPPPSHLPQLHAVAPVQVPLRLTNLNTLPWARRPFHSTLLVVIWLVTFFFSALFLFVYGIVAPFIVYAPHAALSVLLTTLALIIGRLILHHTHHPGYDSSIGASAAIGALGGVILAYPLTVLFLVFHAESSSTPAANVQPAQTHINPLAPPPQPPQPNPTLNPTGSMTGNTWPKRIFKAMVVALIFSPAVAALTGALGSHYLVAKDKLDHVHAARAGALGGLVLGPPLVAVVNMLVSIGRLAGVNRWWWDWACYRLRWWKT